MRQFGPNTVVSIDTDHDDRPEFQGKLIRVDGWNDSVAALLMSSDNEAVETLITVDQAEQILAAVKEAVASS